MGNTCLLYTDVKFWSYSFFKIFYTIKSPRLFIFYLLFYISLFNGFTQGDHVVSRTKMNLYHHYPLHLQNWTALNIYFKRSLRLLFFCSGSTKPCIPQAQAKLSVSIKVNIPSASSLKILMIVVIDVAGCFLSTSLTTIIKPQLLYYL